LSNLLQSRSLANRNSNNTAVFNDAIPYVQELIGRLGPALEDDDNLRDAAASKNGSQDSIPGATTSNETAVYNRDEDSNIDPALRLLQAEQQIHNMPYAPAIQQVESQPVAEASHSHSSDYLADAFDGNGDWFQYLEEGTNTFINDLFEHTKEGAD
jgi:hypothetical protein